MPGPQDWCATSQEPKDGMKPTFQQQLQLCLLNKRSIQSGFQHNSLLWLPIEIDLDGKGEGDEWWYPVRVQWTRCVTRKSTWHPMYKIASFLMGTPHGTKIALRVPGCPTSLIFHVDSQSHLVKQKIAEKYECGGNEEVKENIKLINKEKAEEALKKVTIDLLPSRNTEKKNIRDNLREEQDERLRRAHKGILEHFTDDPSSHIDGFLSDVTSALGHSAEKGYTGPSYEGLYLFVHSLLYFVFFVLLFCTMLAFSSYVLMQFFLMFLLRQTESYERGHLAHEEGHLASLNLSQLCLFGYHFFIPYLLVGVSVGGFEVLLLIRSNVRTPQMSRPRALMIGLFIQILRREEWSWCRRDKWPPVDALLGHSVSPKDKPPDIFWKVLQQAVGFVDKYFTFGIDVFMAMGCIANAYHARLMGYTNYEETLWTTRFWVSLFGTLSVSALLGWLSSDYAPVHRKGGSCSCALEGRMLNWGPWQGWPMLLFMWLGMFICMIDPTVAYTGAVAGGVLWAIFTSSVYMLSDSCLTYKQRELVTVLESCLDDRAIAPGRMEVRFHEIQNKMQQQLKIENTDWNAFPLTNAPSKTPYVAIALVLNIFICYLICLHHENDPVLIMFSLLTLTGIFLTPFLLHQDLKQKAQIDKDESCWRSCWQTSQLLANYTSLGNLFFANLLWVLTFFLNKIISFFQVLPGWTFNIVVLLAAGMLVFATRPFLALFVGCFMIFPNWIDSDEGAARQTLHKALNLAYPALLLIPVMAYWHQVVVRRMPSIRHGFAKATIHRRLYNINGYHVLMLFYSLGSVLLFLVGSVTAQAALKSADVENMGMSVLGSKLFQEDYQSFSYPVCKMRWGPPELNLGVLDLAILANYAYAKTNTTFKKGLEKSFGVQEQFYDVQLVEDGFSDFESIPRVVTTKFISNRSGGGNVTTYVLAFKGTSTASEAFADGSLYSGVAFLGFLSQFVPIFDLLPNTMIAFCLNHLRLRPIKRFEDQGLRKTADYIKRLTKGGKSHIVLTGHSLGGGFASSLAGITQHDAMTFSAPGAHFNRFVFRNTFQRVWRNVVNIWPYADFVPLVDRHDDMVQRIVCRNPNNGTFPGHIACHSIASTICELWRVCGDPRGRRMTLCTDSSLGYTSYNYPEETWGKYIVPGQGPENRSYSTLSW